MNDSSPCKIVKLANGEDIICTIENNEPGKECKVSYPLLMQVVPQRTSDGFVESLRLSKWVQPFTEDLFFEIKSDNIILIADAAPDLCRYYDHVLEKMDEEQAIELIQDNELEEDYLEDNNNKLSSRLSGKTDTVH